MSASRRPERPGLALALLCAVQFMVVLDTAIGNVALPQIREDLGFTEQNLQYVVSLYALTFGGFLLLAGRAGDIFGRRRLFVAGTAIFTASSLACGLAESEGALLAARAAQGLGAALVSPTALALITTMFDEGPERNRALGAWGAVAASGAAAGVILGGVLTDALGWEWCFFVNVPIGTAAIVLAYRLLVEDRVAGGEQRLDLPGALTVTGGIALLVYGLTRGQEEGFGSTEALVLLGGAVLLLAAFLAIESRSARALVPFRIFGVGLVRTANLVGLALAAVIAGQSFFATLYMQQVLGYSPIETGLGFLPITLMAFAGSAAGSQLVGRVGPRALMAAGLAAVALGTLLLARLPLDGSWAADLLPGFALFGAGLGLALVATTIAATDGVDSREQGLASGLVNTAQQLGFAIGVAVLVTVATSASESSDARGPGAVVDGYQAGLLVGSAIAAVGVAIALLSRRAAPS